MGEEEDGGLLLRLQPGDHLREIPRGPGLHGDIRKAAREHRRPASLGKAQLGRYPASLCRRFLRHPDRRQLAWQLSPDQILRQAVLVLDVADGLVRGDRLPEGHGRVHAEVDPERGGKYGIHLRTPEDDAADVPEMRRDRDLEPGAVERRGQDQLGGRGSQLFQQRRELPAALRGPLLEGIEPGNLPFERLGKEGCQALITFTNDNDMARLGPFGHEETQRRGEQDQVADRVGAQVYDGLGLDGHVKGVTSHDGRRVRRASF